MAPRSKTNKTTSGQDSAPGSHRFVTYNVLASHLAEPSHFRHCQPEFLDRDYRMKLIKETLLAEMRQHSVIALQEIGQEWAEELHAFFIQHGYYFICRHYGSKFNDYMGVGLAVPLDTYDVVQVKNKRVADTCWFKPDKKKHWLVTFVLGWVHFFVKLLTGLLRKVLVQLKLAEAPYSAVDHARERWNILACMKLCHKETQQTFWACTYHMPCAFQHPDMMTLHASLALQFIQRLTGAAAPPPKEGETAKEVVP